MGRIEEGKLAHSARAFPEVGDGGVFLHGHAAIADERGEFALKGIKLEFAQERGGFLTIDGPHAHGVEGQPGAAARVERGQLAIEEHGFQLALEFLFQGRLHGLETVADGFKRRIVPEELFRRFLAHAAHAGDVVAGIPDDGLHVGPL